MTKALRGGKVFLDWSQNTAAKTTISPYSLRGRERPYVAAPRTWEEVEEGAEEGLGQLEMDEVLARVARDGDIFGDLLASGRG
jgi:bifunctional non-homologous end joining protein LigD